MSELLMVVGSLNREAPYFQGARGVGLSVLRFDPDTGDATPLTEDRGIDNPTFLSVDDRTGCIYANTEVFGWHEGTVSAYRYEAGARRLAYLNKQASLGSITAHNSLSHDRRHLLVVNYGASPEGEGPDQALVVYGLRDDGALGPALSSVAHRGRGPDPVRQERAHPHCVRQSPDGRFAIVADLGLDAILTYGLGADGRLSSEPVAVSALPPGAGPRHLVFHPEGRLVLVICELNSTVVSLRYSAENGALAALASASTLPPRWEGESHCSDIQFGPRGRFVYGANRGHDSIAMLGLDAPSGELRPMGHISCGGRTPRNLAVDPTGRFLIVANQNSDDLTVLSIDPDTGVPVPLRRISLGSPMCVKFMRA